VIIVIAIAANAGSGSNSANTIQAPATSAPDTGATAMAGNTPVTSQPTQDVQPTTAPTTKQQVATWDETYGYILQTLTSDMNSIGTDGTNQDLVGMNTDCTQLQMDVATAQGLPAIPDAQTASDYGSAITYLAAAAQDCVDGTTGSGDASLLQRAASELNQAATKFTETFFRKPCAFRPGMNENVQGHPND
jgi:hypothetical protein